MITAAVQASQDSWTAGDFVIIGAVIAFVIIFISFIIKPPKGDDLAPGSRKMVIRLTGGQETPGPIPGSPT